MGFTYIKELAPNEANLSGCVVRENLSAVTLRRAPRMKSTNEKISGAVSDGYSAEMQFPAVF